MFAVCCAPVRVFNTSEYPKKRSHSYVINRSDELIKMDKLRQEISKYRIAQAKVKTLSTWALKTSRSATKDLEHILEIIDDMYGEEGFEDI